jgi:fumarate hydratase class II
VTHTASTSEELWGGETRKAVANFPVSGEPIPTPVARWLGRIKAAAARVNGELGLLDADKAQRIAAAADRIANGDLDDQFPIDVFQTGSGTSSNMNANEVIASLAGEGVHANDDVNMGQSSNDVFPSAVHLAALDETVNDLLPALEGLAKALEVKATEFADVVKSGRTARARRASKPRSSGSARSRSAAPPSVPASTRTRNSRSACARSSRRTPASGSLPRPTRSSRRLHETGSSRPRGR